MLALNQIVVSLCSFHCIGNIKIKDKRFKNIVLRFSEYSEWWRCLWCWLTAKTQKIEVITAIFFESQHAEHPAPKLLNLHISYVSIQLFLFRLSVSNNIDVLRAKLFRGRGFSPFSKVSMNPVQQPQVGSWDRKNHCIWFYPG